MSVAPRRAYDHRLRQLVTLAGPAAVNDVSVPRLTVATWRKRGARQVASSHLFDVGDTELRAQLVMVERRLLVLMRAMVESQDLQHMPVSVLSVHAKRVGRVFASASTWARMIRKSGWRRPRKRIHPRPSRIGIRAQRIGELLHIDVTVIRLLDGSKVFVQAVIDNFSRRILAWRISPTLESARTASILRDAVRVLAERGAAAITLMADSGVENIDGAVDAALNATGITRLLAQVEVAWSNSMIEAWFRSLKHNWLFLNSLGSLGAVERLVAFYVQQHDEVMPNAALGGRTPDEVFRGEATDLVERLREKHQVAIAERTAANRRLDCGDCAVPLRRSLAGDESATILQKQE